MTLGMVLVRWFYEVQFPKCGFAKGFMSKTLDDWRSNDSFTLAEAALLIIEQYPDDWADTAMLIKNPPRRFLPIYKRLLTAASTIIDERVVSDDFPDQTYIQYELDTDKPECSEKLSIHDGLSISVWQSGLRKWLTSKGLEAKIFDDDNLAEFEVSEEPTTKNHPNVSVQLSLLNQASTKYWASADRNDRDTHPTNAVIAKWLIEREFSETLANKAATIIRPEWAATGRKPEK